MMTYECLMPMLMLCKSSYARLTPEVLHKLPLSFVFPCLCLSVLSGLILIFFRGFDKSPPEHWGEPWWSFGCGPRPNWLGSTSKASTWGHNSSSIWSGPGWRRRLLFASYFPFLHYILFWSCWFLVAILGSSDSTISGWADVLEAIYIDIGGCSCCIFFFLLFVLCFLHLICC